jgi:hypothetical protein
VIVVSIEILTAVLVVITGLYAFFTFKIMRANEKTLEAVRLQTEAALRPYLDIGVITPPNSHMFMLRIANSGRTAAKNIRMTLDRDFFQYGKAEGTNLRTATAFSQVIEQMSPGAEIRFGLAFGPQLVGESIDERLTPPVFSITATYSFGETTVTEKTTIDVRPYRAAMRIPDPVATELAGLRTEQLAKIASALERIASRPKA